MKTAYVSMLCNGDAYAPGIEALGGSLRASRAAHPFVLLVTPDVTQGTRRRLSGQGWEMREIQPLQNPNPETRLLFPRFSSAFTKLRAFDLTDLDKVVILDADTIVLQNVDDLFKRPGLAAAPDFFMPDRFNSGVMVIEPDGETFQRLLRSLWTSGSYDGGDQGFLNTFYPDWYAWPVEHRLPAGYNLFSFVYQFLRGHPSLKEALEREAKIVHYMIQKPWLAGATLTGGSDAWWNMYFRAHPEQGADWKRNLHAMEDRTFDKVVDALLR